jgi:indole-3-glycerol phosphate synthase
MAADPDVVGINQRDLTTFEVDTARASLVRESIPREVVTVAESGVAAVEDAHVLRDCGFDAVLVGELLMKSGDPRRVIQQMTVRNRLL